MLLNALTSEEERKRKTRKMRVWGRSVERGVYVCVNEREREREREREIEREREYEQRGIQRGNRALGGRVMGVGVGVGESCKDR